MTTTKFISKLIKLKDLKLAWYQLRDRKKELWLGVKPYKNGCCCPECGRRCRILNQLENYRIWRDIVICGVQILLYYAPKEIWCPTHGRMQENIPWAMSNSRITYRLEYLILVYCQMMTQKSAALLLKLPASTLSDLLHRIISRIRSGHKIRKLTTLGIDEISYQKGRKFATIVYNLEKSCVIWIGSGKGRKTADKFFNTLSDYQKKKSNGLLAI